MGKKVNKWVTTLLNLNQQTSTVVMDIGVVNVVVLKNYIKYLKILRLLFSSHLQGKKM